MIGSCIRLFSFNMVTDQLSGWKPQAKTICGTSQQTTSIEIVDCVQSILRNLKSCVEGWCGMLNRHTGKCNDLLMPKGSIHNLQTAVLYIDCLIDFKIQLQRPTIRQKQKQWTLTQELKFVQEVFVIKIIFKVFKVKY